MNLLLDEAKIRKGEIAKLVLATVGMAGILVVGAVAPGLFMLIPRKQRSKFSTSAANRSMEKLKAKGLLKLVRGKSGQRLVLTDKGQAELFAIETKQKLLKKPWRWDKKWRLLIFDIPERKKKIRDLVRLTLISLGFHRLQDSVWVYPYECEDVLELLRTKYGIRHEALYICAERLTKDRWLRQFFSLK